MALPVYSNIDVQGGIRVAPGRFLANAENGISDANSQDSAYYGIHMNNSDMIGVNNIVFNETADAASEGILFPMDINVYNPQSFGSNTIWQRLGVDKLSEGEYKHKPNALYWSRVEYGWHDTKKEYVVDDTHGKISTYEILTIATGVARGHQDRGSYNKVARAIEHTGSTCLALHTIQDGASTVYLDYYINGTKYAQLGYSTNRSYNAFGICSKGSIWLCPNAGDGWGGWGTGPECQIKVESNEVVVVANKFEGKATSAANADKATSANNADTVDQYHIHVGANYSSSPNTISFVYYS